MTPDWETLVLAVCDAWEAVPQSAKGDLMLAHPDLYWACARLAAHGRYRLNLD